MLDTVISIILFNAVGILLLYTYKRLAVKFLIGFGKDFRRASKFFLEDDYDNALVFYQKAANNKKIASLCHYSMGHCYAEKGDAENAIKEYNLAMQLDQDSFSTFGDIGSVYFKSNQLDKAIDCYNKAVDSESEPLKDHSFIMLGRIYNRMNDIKTSLDMFDKALEINNKNAFIYIYRAETHLAAGLNDKAIDDALKAIALSPDIGCLHKSLGDIYTKLGRLRDAEEQFEIAEKLG